MISNSYFSKQARAYAQYRPRYPEALFEYLASLVDQHEAAWDCATGNGQVALGLVPYFERIFATDISEEQIVHAFAHPKIDYAVAPAERNQLANHSINLVTVGMALHWLNLELFYREVQRVLRPGGVLAVWGYEEFQAPSVPVEFYQLLQDFKARIEPFWPLEVTIARDHYGAVPFPFLEIIAPEFDMEQVWTLDELVGYLGTFSATQRFVDRTGTDPRMDLLQYVRESRDEERYFVCWSVFMRVGRYRLEG